MINLIWENEQDRVFVCDEYIEIIRKCIETALRFENFEYDAEISLTITDDEGIKAINREMRGIDKATDVLSFPMLETDDFGALIIYDEDISDGFVMLGDIVISFETAKKQAEEYGHSFLREIGFLTVHSVLHLLGYDHETGVSEETEMFEKQESILKSIDLTR